MNTIYNCTGKRRKNDHRHGKAQAKQAQPERRICQLKNQPAVGYVLHPRAHIRYDQARPQKRKVPVAECGVATLIWHG